MDNERTPGALGSNAGLGPALAEAWGKHAQPLCYQLPAGFGGYVALKTPVSFLAVQAWATAASEVAAAALKLWPRDCRLCANFTTKAGGCVSVVQCVDGNRYAATAPRQYWIGGPNVRGEPTTEAAR